MTEKEKTLKDIAQEAEGIGCPVQRVHYIVREFLAGPMCGRCFPCSMGSYEARKRLENIMAGVGSEADIAALRLIGGRMATMSMCKKGKDTADFLLKALDTGGFSAHLGGSCPTQSCKAMIEYRIEPGLCTMCGACRDACRYDAILGEKKLPLRSGYEPFEIRQQRCVKCGECVPVCPTGAVKIEFKETEATVKA